jgi:hypothetical protein
MIDENGQCLKPYLRPNPRPQPVTKTAVPTPVTVLNTQAKTLATRTLYL